jgi:hypothetical protein
MTSDSSYECPKAPERPGLDAVTATRTVDVAPDESGVFEHLEVL